MKKINLGLIFGGKSAEHEVSLKSAASIYKAIDKEKYDLYLIWVSKEGNFFKCNFEIKNDNILIKNKESLAFKPGSFDKNILNLDKNKYLPSLDVIFPIIHGPFGEDGSLQGFLKLLNIPYVGSEVIGSALGMDKDIMKRLLRDENIDISDYITCKKGKKVNFKTVKDKLGLPFFVKPANLGSSIGISKVNNQKEFKKALDDAFLYDRKIIIEEFIDGREIECSVKGNDKLDVSIPGEIVSKSDFYSYEAKYIDKLATELNIPANLSKKDIQKIKKIALKTAKILELKGLVRIDFFVTDKRIIVNEVNTLPGFTEISMYPKLWIYEGMSYSNLIDELINLAMENFKSQSVLKSTL